MRKKIICFSDSHVGKVSQFNSQQENLFAEFIEKKVLDDNDVGVLVMNGDIFDTWITGPRSAHKTIEEICSENYTRFCDVVKSVVEKEGVDVYYVRGNHDMEDIPNDSLLNLMDPDPENPKMKICDALKLQNIHFEHGHRFDVFNCCTADSPTSNWNTAFPSGYYITRAHIGENQDNFIERTWHGISSSFEGVWSFVDKTPEYLYKEVLELFLDGYKNDDYKFLFKNDAFVTKNSVKNFYMNYSGVQGQEFVSAYKNSFNNDRDKRMGFVRSNFPTKLEKFSWFKWFNTGEEVFDPKDDMFLFDQEDCSVVCVGHTHEPSIIDRGRYTYVNSGELDIGKNFFIEFSLEEDPDEQDKLVRRSSLFTYGLNGQNVVYSNTGLPSRTIHVEKEKLFEEPTMYKFVKKSGEISGLEKVQISD